MGAPPSPPAILATRNPMSTRLSLVIITIMLLATSGSRADEEWGQCQVWPQPHLEYPGEDRGDLSATYLGADSSESRNAEIIDLSGDITLQRPTLQLFADQATYYRALKSLEARGHIRYESESFATEADYALIDMESNRGRFDNSRYMVPKRHVRGGSKSIEIDEERTVLRKASYTTCDPGSESWTLRASSVILDQAHGIGSAWNARLVFQGLPFFYFPYLRFPITNERMTGLLAPSFGSTRLGGAELALPLYINLHPQVDATLTPHYYSNRGLKWNSEIRYLSHYGEGKVRAERLKDDVYGDTRSLFEYNHGGSLGRWWRGDILFNRVSDRYYFNDFGNTLSVSSLTHLERHARLSYRNGDGEFFIQAQDFQTIDDTTLYINRPYRRLPQVTYMLLPHQVGPLQLALNSELTRFQQEERLTGNRLNVTPSVTLPYLRPAGFIIPKLTLSHTSYRLEDDNNTLGVTQLERNLAITSLDSGLFFERDTDLFGRSYLHTLEPRAYYLYAPYRNQENYPVFDSAPYDFSLAQLFRNNRFAGADRIGDANQLTVAVTSRLLKQHDGREVVRGTVGQIHYFEDRRVTLPGSATDDATRSETVVDAEFRPVRPLSLRGDLFWDSDSGSTTRRDLRLLYMSDDNHIANVNYRERTINGSEKREIDSSLLWPLNSQWSMIGRRYHSLSDGRTLEQLAGLEYNDCCWALRAVRRAAYASAAGSSEGTLRYSWYLQLELKGLTSLGDKIDTIMQNKILGYTTIP